jgi:hypothetical protein
VVSDAGCGKKIADIAAVRFGNVVVFPLFRRCCAAVFSLISAAVLRGKMTATQRLGREWLQNF